jgi:hypothetical protein
MIGASGTADCGTSAQAMTARALTAPGPTMRRHRGLVPFAEGAIGGRPRIGASGPDLDTDRGGARLNHRNLLLHRLCIGGVVVASRGRCEDIISPSGPRKEHVSHKTDKAMITTPG